MPAFRLPGILWIIGGVMSALLVFFVLDIPAYAVVLGVGGVAGIVIGALLVRRPSADVLRWSNITGIAWLIAYGWVTVTDLDKPVGEWLTVVVIAAIGVAGSLIAYMRRGQMSTTI
jgi:hypothetical protein